MFKKKKVLAATQGGGYQQMIVADGATYFWRLDEPSGTVAADSVDGATGTIGASGVTLNQPGAIIDGKSMTFNGSVPARITTLAVVNTPVTFTLEAWFKGAAQLPTFESLFSTRDATITSGIFLGTNGNKIIVIDTSGHTLTGVLNIRDANWHYIVVTGNGTTGIIYIDGVVDVSAAFARVIPDASLVNIIAGDIPGGLPLTGSLDEIAIYPLILTPTQIATHYSFKSTASVLTYKQQVIADGASAYWPMDNVGPPITDLAGTRNASVSGSPTFGVPGPRAATAMTFSRTASAIPPSAVPVGLSFTLEAWIRRTAVFTRAFIMARNITSQNDWYLAFNTTGSDRIQFAYRDVSTTNTFFFPITFPLNTWTYVVLVVTGTVLQLYVNGLPVGASQPMVTLGGAGSGAFQLASNIGSASEAWGGQLADLAIYPLVLSADKILAHSTAL